MWILDGSKEIFFMVRMVKQWTRGQERLWVLLGDFQNPVG